MLEALCIPIPFIFYRYGGKIRQKSKLIREMRENKEKQERRKKRAEEKAKRRIAGERHGNTCGPATFRNISSCLPAYDGCRGLLVYVLDRAGNSPLARRMWLPLAPGADPTLAAISGPP